MTLRPRRRNTCAILPIVVVLPVPLTPTTRKTCGRASGASAKSCATGSSTLAISPARISRTWSGSNSTIETALGHSLANAPSHRHPEIRLDQHFFELVERLLIEPSLDQRMSEIVGQRTRRAREALAKLIEPAPSRLLGHRFRLILVALGRRKRVRRLAAWNGRGTGGRRRGLGRGLAFRIRRRRLRQSRGSLFLGARLLPVARRPFVGRKLARRGSGRRQAVVPWASPGISVSPRPSWAAVCAQAAPSARARRREACARADPTAAPAWPEA